MPSVPYSEIVESTGGRGADFSDDDPEPPDPDPAPTTSPGTVDDIQSAGPTTNSNQSGFGSGTSRSGDNSGSGGNSGSGVDDGRGGDPEDVSPDVAPGPETTPAPGVTNEPDNDPAPDNPPAPEQGGGGLVLAAVAGIVALGAALLGD